MSNRSRRKKRREPRPDPATEPGGGALPRHENEFQKPAPRRWHPVFEWSFVILAIFIAWGISAWFRSDWCRVNSENAQYKWEGRLLPTTHDSYFFASAIKHGGDFDPSQMPLHPTVNDYGALTILGHRAASLTGKDVAEVVTYMPVLLGGLIAIPVVLIGRKYGSITWGFGAACIAGMGYSYYNRTIAGYFDTDLFSIFLPAMALYCLLSAHRDQSRVHLICGVLILFGFQFFYPSGASISIALGISYLGFRIAWSTWHQINRLNNQPDSQWHFTSESIIMVSTGLFCCNYCNPNLMAHNIIPAVVSFVFMAVLFTAATVFHKILYEKRPWALHAVASVALPFLLLFGAPMQQIRDKTMQYLPQRNATDGNVTRILKRFFGFHENQAAKAGVHALKLQTSKSSPTPQYKNVLETIVEARSVPLFPKIESTQPGGKKVSRMSSLIGFQHGHTVAERVSGSSMAFVLALLGYILLVIIYPEFIMAIPFIGIGFFAHWGGHRFTIHMVPIAAIGLAFLPLGIIEMARRIFKSFNIDAPENCDFTVGAQEQYNNHGSWFSVVLGARVTSILIAAFFLIPNVIMAQARSATLQPVLLRGEVELIDEIRKASKPGDYVHTWWDWGTAIWYHSKRNVLTHPGNQSSDTYICAKMLMTDSPRLSAHLGRTAVEYYHHGDSNVSRRLAVNYIFNGKETPAESLASLKEHLPVQSTRDVFMYLPYRLIGFYQVLHMFSERDLATGKENPIPQFLTFHAWQRKGNAVYLSVRPGGQPEFLVDLAQLTLTDLRRGVPPLHAQAIWKSGKNPFPNSRALTFILANNLLLHGKPIEINKDGFNLKLLNGKTGHVPLKEIKKIYPARLLKQVEQPGIQETHTVEGAAAQRPGLHVICSQNPPMALIADEAAYKSLMVQMLVLDRPDPEYFEKVIENGMGRVFKLKGPKQ
jgi:dolichyl-diphosphooligosaccharide--protein glycosyltransferase/undecaprenyl-diphosphooligosaccharide--protein glycosyltransferase